MAGIDDLENNRGMAHRLLTNHKERRAQPQLAKLSQDRWRAPGMRAVVERQDDRAVKRGYPAEHTRKPPTRRGRDHGRYIRCRAERGETEGCVTPTDGG